MFIMPRVEQFTSYLSELFQNRYPLDDRTTVRLYTWNPSAEGHYQLPSPQVLRPLVSLIVTVKNERQTIDAWFDSVESQSWQPSEIVIVDGGSTDGTFERLQERAAHCPVPVKLRSCPGANIARGRNLAIESARGPIIACTDAGCILTQDWLAAITGPFADDQNIEVVSGYYFAVPRTTFAALIASYLIRPVEEVNPANFLPSARSIAFTKAAWQRVGGFPEWLTLTAEDTLFDIGLKRETRLWAFVPDAKVEWGLKTAWRELFSQIRAYARGDGEAGLFPEMYRQRIALSALFLATATLAILGIILAGLTRSVAPLALSGFLIMAFAYRIRPFMVRPSWIAGGIPWLAATCESVVIALIITTAMSLGFLQGVRLRYRFNRSSP